MRFSFYMVCVWLFIIIGRPQDIFPGLKVIHPGDISAALAILSFFLSSARQQTKPLSPELKLFFLEDKTCRVGDWVKVPRSSNHAAIQTIIHFPSKISAFLVTAIYKGPGYTIQYRLDNGHEEIRRFTPTKAEEGFLVAPLILSNFDYVTALSNSEWNKFIRNEKCFLRKIVEFRVSCNNLQLFCANEMIVQFNEIYGLDFGRFGQNELNSDFFKRVELPNDHF